MGQTTSTAAVTTYSTRGSGSVTDRGAPTTHPQWQRTAAVRRQICEERRVDFGKAEEWWDSLSKLLFDLQFWMRWMKKLGSKSRWTGGGAVIRIQIKLGPLGRQSRSGGISTKGGRNQRATGEREEDTGVTYQGNEGSREVKHTQGWQH